MGETLITISISDFFLCGPMSNYIYDSRRLLFSRLSIRALFMCRSPCALGAISQAHRAIIRKLKKATKSSVTALFICAMSQPSHTERSSDAFVRMYPNHMSVSDISSLIA